MSNPRFDPARSGDRDLWWVFGLLSAACAARVGGALLQSEVFGADATAAAACLIGVPLLLLGGRGRAQKG